MTSRFESGKSMGFASGPLGKVLVAGLLFSVTGGCSPPEPVHQEITLGHQEASSPVPASRVVSELEVRERMEAAAETRGQESDSGTIETSNGSVTIGAEVRIAVLDGVSLYLVERTGDEPSCEVTNGDAVTIVAATYYEDTDSYDLKVAVTGTNCQGWIPENFVQP